MSHDPRTVPGRRALTLTGAVEAIYGRLLTLHSPVRFDVMIPGDREALLLSYREAIEADVEGLLVLVGEAESRGIAALYSALRNAEGVDPDMIDELVSSLGDRDGEDNDR